MNIAPNVNLERIEEADLKLQFQLPKCLSGAGGGEYLAELAGYISSDMCSLSASPHKRAILQETLAHIPHIKLAKDCGSSDDLQKSEVSSSNPTIFGSDLLAPLLLHALDGFLFVVNTEGKIECVSENVKSFLKYNHENLVEKSIYNIIHVGDHARFSSNLLPMSIGNGFGWSEPNEQVSKSRSFNCRFLVQPPDDQDETMEEKQTRVSHYENMQISAVLLPGPRDGKATEAGNVDDLETDIQNRLVCVARRLPSSDSKSNTLLTEQFQTRLDCRGKIISIDTSGVSATYSQYLNKDLVGCIIQELCHPDDFQKCAQHLTETLQQGSSTSGIFRLRLAHEKIVYLQTKSKRLNAYNPMASDQEVILANHSIISRESDHLLESSVAVSQRSNPSPAGGSLALNGNSYSFSTLSPHEFNLNDIGLDFLPTSSWDLGGTSDAHELDLNSLPTSLGGPSTPASSSSVNSTPAQQHPSNRSQHPSGNTTFSPEQLVSPATQSPPTNSPAPPPGGRATPFSNSFQFSPQTISRTSSPAPNMMKAENMNNGLELQGLSPMGGLMGGDGGQQNTATQKLRNLLTHGIEEADSSVAKNSDKMDIPIVKQENGFLQPRSNDANDEQNVILRELLNQDDDDISDDVKNLNCDTNSSVNSDLSDLQKRTMNNNSMLRKVSLEMNSIGASQQNPGCGRGMDPMNHIGKRKSPDTPMEDSVAKRAVPHHPQHAQLAGQNPMLASMLAQTPRTAPSVPTSIANAIVSQLPQERLPKNLEKKLVHTPYTGSNTPTNSQYNLTQVQMGARNLLSTSLQQDIVTADARGHVTLAPQSGFPQGPAASFMSKMGAGDPSMGYGGFSLGSQQGLQNSANLLIDGLAEVGKDPNNVVSASDPLLSDILDQVWSMEQDMNLESVSDELAFYKLLEELPAGGESPKPPPPSAQDVHEKLAIHAIQRQLMSFEVSAQPMQQRNSPRFTQQQLVNQLPVSSYSNQFQGAPPAYTMSNPGQRIRAPGSMHMPGGPMSAQQMQMAQMNSQRHNLPQYGAVNSVNDLNPQLRRQILEQQKQKLFLQQKQRLMLQKQQQQLLAQQGGSQGRPTPDGMQSPASSPFASDPIGELMGSSVAPNVTLQRSASMPEPQLSPRYAGPPASPSQLSPGQRPAFSPLPPGAGYPGNSYQQSRLPSQVSAQQGTPANQVAWMQRTAQNPANLQQQNPMLNAQLSSQQQTFASQGRFQGSSQRGQLGMGQMPSPGGSRNSPFSNPPDSPFHPPSPSLYPQPPPTMPQQRLQRAVSIPNRVNSPRGLPSGFSGGTDPLLSPQPSPGSYNNPPVSGYNPAAMPVSTSTGFPGLDGFSGYEQQVYPGTAMIDRNRGNNGGAIRSEFVRQELQAKVRARTQQLQVNQVHQQQLVQQLPQAAASQASNQSLSQADFDALGFALELANDGQPSSPALYPQSLMNASNSNDNQTRTSSPRFQLEEQRPTEQKKSLLQQLLSEPP